LPPLGCCRGSSYKAQAKCLGLEDENACVRKDCEWLLTEDPTDCDITTTESPTTTSEAGCCYGEGVKENEMCANKEGRDQCERSSSCEFREGEDADCEYVPTTTTSEAGCCYGDTSKTNAMCAEKDGRESCERSGKCVFKSGEDADCELPTTTSEPWLGAQEEDYQLPYNPYKQSKSKKSSRKGHRQEEAMLFGGQNVVGEAMNYQVSLSSVLLLVIAAFAVYQVYRWFANSKGYKAVAAPVQAQRTQYYQSA